MFVFSEQVQVVPADRDRSGSLCGQTGEGDRAAKRGSISTRDQLTLLGVYWVHSVSMLFFQLKLANLKNLTTKHRLQQHYFYVQKSKWYSGNALCLETADPMGETCLIIVLYNFVLIFIKMS